MAASAVRTNMFPSNQCRPRALCRAICNLLKTSTCSHIPSEIEHLVILPDKPKVLKRRVEIRPRHAPNFVRLHNEGYVSWAGPVFDAHVDGDITKRPFKGSVMVVNEQDWNGFMERVGSDIYVQEGIWDLEKTRFIKFRTLMCDGKVGENKREARHIP